MSWRPACALASLLLVGTTAPAAAQQQGQAPILVPDVSQHQIELRSGFTGAELLLFGAIAYPGGRIPDGQIDIVVVIEGPRTPITVREKAKLGGLIWVNAESNSYRTAPSFYAVASSRPIADIMDDREAYVYEIGLKHLQLSPLQVGDTQEQLRFRDGLIATNMADGRFAQSTGSVEISQKLLYSARIAIPASVPEGRYDASTYLVRNGKVQAAEETEVVVAKRGVEQFISLAADRYGFLYGLAAILLSLGLGWLAGVLFQRRQ
ncbi:TIGR02186 family protein [Novosphingopyxis baekryungensis]|uniref:TIGR02186 family protein n=1 Tax=Novosphingopyxis baekryungensis TaxID=279369 RepID=UPI0003B69233|nr:TIGR02186 family protein [Novosphingopyxis baekryungensis]